MAPKRVPRQVAVTSQAATKAVVEAQPRASRSKKTAIVPGVAIVQEAAQACDSAVSPTARAQPRKTAQQRGKKAAVAADVISKKNSSEVCILYIDLFFWSHVYPTGLLASTT
jgi:hypothetical protein